MCHCNPYFSNFAIKRDFAISIPPANFNEMEFDQFPLIFLMMYI